MCNRRHLRRRILFGLTLVTACRLPMTGQPDVSHEAVFILLDGIPADVVERVPTPALDEIAAAGGYTRAYVGGERGGPTETPTISAPGYMSVLTATWANKHNVRGNSNQSPNYAYWNIFRIVESVDPSRKTALFSKWRDNRTVLVGEGRPGAGSFTDELTGKGHGRQSTRERTTWIVTNRPHLTARFTNGTPAIVDITPSILQHLRIAAPAEVATNMDGVSFLRRGSTNCCASAAVMTSPVALHPAQHRSSQRGIDLLKRVRVAQRPSAVCSPHGDSLISRQIWSSSLTEQPCCDVGADHE